MRKSIPRDWKHKEYSFPDGRTLSFADAEKLAAHYREPVAVTLERFEKHKMNDPAWKPEGAA